MNQELIKELMHYDKESGICTLSHRDKRFYEGNEEITKRVNTKITNKKVLKTNDSGYIEIRIFKRLYRLHRLIWLYMTGEWPDQVDHIDGYRSNNKWENLRSVTKTENNRNMKLRENSTSGVIGVSYSKSDNLWHSYININRKRINLGWFKDKEKAIRARKEAEIKYGYHPNHGRAVK